MPCLPNFCLSQSSLKGICPVCSTLSRGSGILSAPVRCCLSHGLSSHRDSTFTLCPRLSIPAVPGIPDFLKGSSWHCCFASWQLESSPASQSHLAAGGESGWNMDEPICPCWCVERWRGWRWTLGSVTALESCQGVTVAVPAVSGHPQAPAAPE